MKNPNQRASHHAKKVGRCWHLHDKREGSSVVFWPERPRGDAWRPPYLDYGVQQQSRDHNSHSVVAETELWAGKIFLSRCTSRLACVKQPFVVDRRVVREKFRTTAQWSRAYIAAPPPICADRSANKYLVGKKSRNLSRQRRKQKLCRKTLKSKMSVTTRSKPRFTKSHSNTCGKAWSLALCPLMIQSEPSAEYTCGI